KKRFYDKEHPNEAVMISELTPPSSIRIFPLERQAKANNILLERLRGEKSALEEQARKLKNSGEFAARVVRIKSGEGWGSGFVVDDIDGYYVLMLTHHQLSSRWIALGNKYRCERYSMDVSFGSNLKYGHIGKADVVIGLAPETPGLRDKDIDIVIAVLKTDKKLKPFNIMVGHKGIQPVVLVGGFNDSVSCGYSFHVDEQIKAFYMKTKRGDSGAPYLIKAGNEYRPVGVHWGRGNLG
ncbi:MAG TPA: hypothetical protein DCL49_08855, partial [Candidatus Omnitrophica bacterium]|nr:hypothetical protein [Candidatus Omnitrophota bacterium]